MIDTELVILWACLLLVAVIVGVVAGRELFRVIGRTLANVFFGRVSGGRK